jgi:hypothetical protein
MAPKKNKQTHKRAVIEGLEELLTAQTGSEGGEVWSATSIVCTVSNGSDCEFPRPVASDLASISFQPQCMGRFRPAFLETAVRQI